MVGKQGLLWCGARATYRHDICLVCYFRFLLISLDHKVDRKRQFALRFGTYGVNAEFLEVLYNLRRWAVLGLENIDGSIVGRMMGAT